MHVFERSVDLACSVPEAFAYHAAPLAFSRLTPPWDSAAVVDALPSLANDARATFDIGVGPARVRWVARHEQVRDGKDGGVAGFVDVAERGPFSHWRHEHRIEPLSMAGEVLRCRLTDHIEWSGPLRGAGDVVGAGFVEKKLGRMFRYRHDTMCLDVALLAALPRRRRSVVGVTGASGLIGAEVCNLLSVAGHDVRRFVRRPARSPDELSFHPLTGEVDPRADGLDAVVHLAGENIAQGRLSDDKRARIRSQRVDGTRHFLAALSRLPRPPATVVCASAIGIYGDRGDEVLTETSAPGRGFLAQLCADWEDAALSSSSPWRAVALRFGIVLSLRGGALNKALPAFRAGLGGPFGTGQAWMPLLTVDDAAAVVLRSLVDERMQGPVCAVGEQPVRNHDFAKTLGRVLGRPAVLPAPRFALRAVLGDVADHMLESTRVVPERLHTLGHGFRHKTLENGLRHVLGRWD